MSDLTFSLAIVAFLVLIMLLSIGVAIRVSREDSRKWAELLDEDDKTIHHSWEQK